MRVLMSVVVVATLFIAPQLEGQPVQEQVSVQTVEDTASPTAYQECRRMLVGPGINEPDPYPGYGGFVGWQAPILLKDGTLLVTFSAGYWHASPPTPLKMDEGTLKAWGDMGMPIDIDAPTGGRAMLIRSTDGGVTWSKPETMIDTPWDDRSPACVELPDGTLVCSFFTYPGVGDAATNPELACRTAIIRSFDGGATWEQEIKRLPSPFVYDATDGPPILLQDGSIALAVYGKPADGAHDQAAVFGSTDRGETWELLSVIRVDHEMSEAGMTQLPDGKLVMVSRSEGDVLWSEDGGRTWTEPVSFGMRMFEPGLLALKDGTLLCLHGSYGAGGFRAILSKDGGKTWIGPDPKFGFVVDPSVYGYGRGVEMPDGSVFMAYIHTGGHRTEDAQTEGIWGMSLRVRPDGNGVEVLPAPGK